MSTIPNRRRFIKGAALCAAALVCHGPARLWAAVPEEAVTQTRLLLGTFVRMSAVHTDSARAANALNSAFDTVARLQSLFDRHNSASPLATLNTQGSLYDAPPALAALLLRAQRFHALTEGAFDVTVAPVIDAARAGKNRSGALLVDAQALANARDLVHMPSLRIEGTRLALERQGMALTLDGIAKGYIADCAAATLQDCGIINYLVDAGGDIRAQGHKAPGLPWRVAVAHPTHKDKNVAVLALNGSIATSGGSETYYDATGSHHHIVRPQSGQSPTGVYSATVTAPDTLSADALATALTVMTPRQALRLVGSLAGVECCLITRQGSVTSAGFGA